MTVKRPNEPVSDDPEKLQSKKHAINQIRLVKSKIGDINSFSPRDFSVSRIKAPHGFRVLSTSQALWEYSLPLMYMVPAPEDVSKANEIFDVVTTIWNATIDNFPVPQKKSDEEVLAMIQERLGLDKNRAKTFFSMMLERKDSLFPNDIQPKGVPFLFMRKERSYLINRFDYESLGLNDDLITPDTFDLEFIKNLEKLDQYILESASYDKYEELLLKVRDECRQRFRIWLTNKGIKKADDEFSFFTDIYVSFIYVYRNKEPITLKSAPGDYLVEFMVEHLLRKTSIEPREYTLCPAAMRLFYKFLHEKGYLAHPPDPMIDYIDKLETYFLDILRERFF